MAKHKNSATLKPDKSKTAAKLTKPFNPHQFILHSPSRPLAQEEVREFVLQHDFPLPWGPSMESELKNHLTALGFQKVWCQCLETHRVARIRMKCGASEPPPAIEIRRLL